MYHEALISVISEQTIPNYQVIKAFDKVQYIILVYSKKVESQKSWVEYSVRRHLQKNNIVSLEIDEYDLKANLEKLKDERAFFESFDKLYLNITGGTKIMSISLYDYFKNNFSEKTEICYLSLDKDLHFIFPENKKISIEYAKINVKEYLNCYGFIERKNKNKLKKDQDFNFNNFKMYEFKDAPQEFNKISSNIYAALKTELKISEINRKTNGQFGSDIEDFIYHYIRRQLRLNDDQIFCGVKIFLNQSAPSCDFEYDTMFVYNNKLYIFEVKSNLKGLIDITNHYSSIKQIFGLNTFACLVTLRQYNQDHINKYYYERLRHLGIKKILGIDEFLMMLDNKFDFYRILN